MLAFGLLVGAQIVGFGPARERTIARAFEVSELPRQKLHCVSWQEPLGGRAWLSPLEVDAILERISVFADCVRTYTLAGGLDVIPMLAEKRGMHVWLGFPIRGTRDAVDFEISRAAVLSKLFKSVEVLIAGSEAVQFGRVDYDEQVRIARRLRAEGGAPVMIAENAVTWKKHPELADEVDLIGLHVYSAWGGSRVDDAVAETYRQHAALRALFPGRPVWIAETGWPSAGGGAFSSEFSVENAFRYYREFVARAEREGIVYNYLDSFDDPFRGGELLLGPHWGVLRADGTPKFPMVGQESVRAPSDLPYGLLAALLGALGCGFAYAFRPRLPFRWHLASFLAMHGMAGLLAYFAYVFAQDYLYLSWPCRWLLAPLPVFRRDFVSRFGGSSSCKCSPLHASGGVK